MNSEDSAEGPILIVEDNDDSRYMLRKVLERRKFRVVEATNGLDAIAVAEQHRPRLILMDLRMPVLDGISAIQQIRKLEHLSRVPILILSGDWPLSKEAFFEWDELDSELTQYLIKPFEEKELMAQVEKFLASDGSD